MISDLIILARDAVASGTAYAAAAASAASGVPHQHQQRRGRASSAGTHSTDDAALALTRLLDRLAAKDGKAGALLADAFAAVQI